MDIVEALENMKRGDIAYKKSEPQVLYNAVFNDHTRKYTIYANGKEMTENADWDSFFYCTEWEVKK